MKSKVLALLIPALLAAGAAHAAEVYNKDGNKLDLYGKVDGLHYFSDNSAKDGDQSYALMNPLMILVKIIKLRWIHILSYDQMVSRKINNQTTRCANSIF
ncbi:porin, partial [Escherichia coli]|uniref:porin n=6 Tax=Escherichia coli TaxID=562 RepID=UPI000BE53191